MNSLLPIRTDPLATRPDAPDAVPIQRVAFVGPIAETLAHRLANGRLDAVLRLDRALGGGSGAATFRLDFPGLNQSVTLDAAHARALAPGLATDPQASARLTLVLGGPRTDGALEARIVGLQMEQPPAAGAPAAGGGGERTVLSDAARLLAQLLPAAAGDDAALGPPALVKMLSAEPPTPERPAPTVAEWANQLAQLPRSAGVGYERALARWTLAGADAQDVPALQARWPQAQQATGYVAAAAGTETGAAAPALMPAAGILAREAQALESGHANWRGQLWPGAPAEVQIGRGRTLPEDAPQAARDWLDAATGETPAWLRLHMDLPTLGALDLWAVHTEGRSLVRLTTADPRALQALQAAQPQFAANLAAAHAQLVIANTEVTGAPPA
jgi:hypothetical protein